MIGGDGMREPDALREEIRQTRAELGQTVQALAAKADVKSRIKESTAQRKEQLREQAMQKKDQLRGRATHGREVARDHMWHGAYTARGSVREIGTLVRRYPVPVVVGAGVGAFLITFLAFRRRRG